MARKPRLYGKREPRLPVPSYRKKKSNSFPLRAIENADQRFSIVKELRHRLEQVKNDAGCDTIQKEWMCARAVFIVARLESMEYDAVTGQEIEWKEYLMATRALSDVLNKLGLDRAVANTKRLETYLLEARKQNGKHKVLN